jgi:hypothetical protein
MLSILVYCISTDESTSPFCYPYTMTFYYLTSTFTTTAYGDIYAITTFEMVFISLFAISSKVWFGLCLSDILSGVQNYIDLSYHLASNLVLVSRSLSFHSITTFTYRYRPTVGMQAFYLHHVYSTSILFQKLYRDYGVPPQLLDRVKSYLTHAWAQNKGNIIPELLDQAPECLRIDILYATYSEHFNNVRNEGSMTMELD